MTARTVKSRTRLAVERALVALDDEAFSWLPETLLRLWPSGLGGFRDAEGIMAVQTAARAYLGAFQPTRIKPRRPAPRPPVVKRAR